MSPANPYGFPTVLLGPTVYDLAIFFPGKRLPEGGKDGKLKTGRQIKERRKQETGRTYEGSQEWEKRKLWGSEK